MKLLVVIALLGFAAAGPREHHVNFCRGNSEAREDAGALRAVIQIFLPNIIGHCPTASAALAAGTFFNNECEVAFDQGFCYASSKIAEYDVADKLAECSGGEGDDYTVTTTYKDMARVLSAGSDVHKLGHLACSHALPCFEHLVSQIAECADNDDTFYRIALDKAVKLVKPLIAENAGAMDEFVACHFGAESDAMTLLGLVQDRITSFDDVVALFNEYFSADDQTTIATNARTALYSFLEGANDFCDAGCIRKTARFFKQLFSATHDEGTCPVVGLYCGGCQDNADQFISGNAASVPCCTQDALDSISEAVYGMIAKYRSVAAEIEGDIKAAAEAAGVSTADYEAMKALGFEQAACLSETYDTLSESDCS